MTKAQRMVLVRHKLLVVILLAVLARLIVLLAFPSVFAFDQTGQVHGSEAYDVYAQNLLATGVYGRTPGQPDAIIPPLYSYVLALVYAVVGRGYVQVGLFHALLDVLSIAMLFETGKRLFPRGEGVGALAGLFYALYPYLIFQNLTLIDTPFFMALLHAFVLLMVRLRQRETLDRTTWLLAVLGGVVLGLSLLTRPILPLLALLIAVWFLFRRSLWQTIARLLPVALIGALVIVPWVTRNYGVYQIFVPISLTAASNFFQGNNPDVIPYLRAGYDPQWIGPKPFAADPNSPAGERERVAQAMQYLNEHPEQIPELLWQKFITHWSIDVFPRRNPVNGQIPRLDYNGNAIASTDAQGNLTLGDLPPGDPVGEYARPLFDQIGRMIHRWYFGPLLALALVGVGLSARYWRDVSILWFVQISMTVMYVIFHPSTRYRVPSDPLLFLFSGYTLVWVYAWWQRRREAPAKRGLERAEAETLRA